MPSWDPSTYLDFAAERARPFDDLIARVGATRPGRVVDLGCGPGTLTRRLAERWPGATVVGVDSSPEMVHRARQEGVSAVLADVADWTPDGPVDVVVANALLHWVPGHLDLLRRWCTWLTPDGWIAVQVPGNGAAPTHALLREVAARPRYERSLRGMPTPPGATTTADYAAALAAADCDVDAWETTYLHLLDPDGRHADDAVLAWARGTLLRPALDALDADPATREAFLLEYGARLRCAYPRRAWGTPLPYRRVFAVGRRLTAQGR